MFAVLLPDLIRHTYFVILYVIPTIFEKRTQGWGIKRVPTGWAKKSRQLCL